MKKLVFMVALTLTSCGVEPTNQKEELVNNKPVRYDNEGYNHDEYIPTFIIKDLKPNWLEMGCLIHNWKYSDVLKDLSYIIYNTNIKMDPIPIKVRICKRCGKKQESIGYGFYNFIIRDYVNWNTVELTLEEEREFKINKLLK